MVLLHKNKVAENLLRALYSSDQRGGGNDYRFVVDKLQKGFSRV